MLIKIQELKFCPGIVFAICTNQLHLPKKKKKKKKKKKHGRDRLKPVSKTGFEEMEHGFPFGRHSNGENKTGLPF